MSRKAKLLLYKIHEHCLAQGAGSVSVAGPFTRIKISLADSSGLEEKRKRTHVFGVSASLKLGILPLRPIKLAEYSICLAVMRYERNDLAN